VLGQIQLPVSIAAAHEGLRTLYTSIMYHLLLVHFSKVKRPHCSLLLKVVAAIHS